MNKTYRAIKLNTNDGSEQILELSKATVISNTPQEFIHFDKMKDGTWRVIWSERTISDFSKIKSFEILRDKERGTQI